MKEILGGIAILANLMPNGLPLTTYVLPNQLRLYVVENHSAPVFTYQTWIGTGSKSEKLDPQIHATGLAHLFEHMMFRGTPKNPDGVFDEKLFEAGATDQNATTWTDRTNYYESLPKDQLDLIANLESDRLVNLDVTQHFETERSAVLGELAMVQDDPVSVGQELLYQSAFSVHPYKYSVIGTEAEIKSFTASEASDFYKKYYNPSNVSILVVGDVDPEVVRQMITTYYGSIAQSPLTPVTVPQEPVQTVEQSAQFLHPQLTEPKIFIGYHAPAAADPDFAAMSVLRSVLALGDGSLLHQNWVEAGKGTGLHSELGAFQDPGLLTFVLDLQPGVDPQDAIVALNLQIAQIIANPAGIDVERAINQLLLSIYPQWNNNALLASYLGESLIATGDPLAGFHRVDAIQAVTAADVARVAQKYLASTHRTVVVGRAPQ